MKNDGGRGNGHRSRTAIRANVSTVLVHLAAAWLEDTGSDECAEYLRTMRDGLNGVSNAEMVAIERAVQDALREYRIETGRARESAE